MASKAKTEGKSTMSLTDTRRFKEKLNLLSGQKPSPAVLNKAAEISYKLAANAPGMESQTGGNTPKVRAWADAATREHSAPAGAAVQGVDSALSALPGGRIASTLGTAASAGGGVAQGAYTGAMAPKELSGPTPSWHTLGRKYVEASPWQAASGALGGLANLVGGAQSAPLLAAGNAIGSAIGGGTASVIDPENRNEHITRAAAGAAGAPLSYGIAKQYGSLKNIARTPLGQMGRGAAVALKSPGALKMLARLGARASVAGMAAGAGQGAYNAYQGLTDEGQIAHGKLMGEQALREQNMGVGGKALSTLGDLASAATGDTQAASARIGRGLAAAGLNDDARDTIAHELRVGNAGEAAYNANLKAKADWGKYLALPKDFADPEYAKAYQEAADQLSSHLGDLKDFRTYTQLAGQKGRAPVMPAYASKYDFISEPVKQKLLQEFGPSIFGKLQEDGTRKSVLDNPVVQQMFTTAANNPQAQLPQ